LQIHSVARHASEVRRLRGLKGWITGNEEVRECLQQLKRFMMVKKLQAGYNTATLLAQRDLMMSL
jgi:hypothetical protein